jgi:hypothetical protein
MAERTLLKPHVSSTTTKLGACSAPCSECTATIVDHDHLSKRKSRSSLRLLDSVTDGKGSAASKAFVLFCFIIPQDETKGLLKTLHTSYLPLLRKCQPLAHRGLYAPKTEHGL